MLHYRNMQAKDAAASVAIIADNPLLGPRYGSCISELERVWGELLGRLAFTAVVFEESGGAHGRLVGPAVSVFVSDEFVRDLKTAPLCWIGPEIVRRVVSGASPLLSDKEVVEANSTGGLNLVGWDGATSSDDARRPEVLNFSFVSFVELHRGFRIKELLGQADSPEHLEAMRHLGASFFDPERCTFGPSMDGSAEEVVRKPHLMGSTREMALAGTWLSGSALFASQAPKFYFSPGEQRLLSAALQGGTDEEISQRLNISLSLVRRRWLSIYERVAADSPEVFGPSEPFENERIAARGKGKKHRLLAYLRDHPEELRPVLRPR